MKRSVPEPSTVAIDIFPEGTFSTAEVARLLGVSVPTVQRWVDQNLLQAWKTLGGHRRVDTDSARALLAHSSLRERPLGCAMATRPACSWWRTMRAIRNCSASWC